MNRLVDNLANLVKVKTIVTMIVAAVFAVLSLNGTISPDNVMIIISMVVSFYFGTQHEKDKQRVQTYTLKNVRIQQLRQPGNKRFVGKLVPCIIECYSDEGEVIARTQYDAPEIDGIVNIKTDKHVVPGDIELVRIVDASPYDLVGEL